jgi:hypothetical protein
MTTLKDYKEKVLREHREKFIKSIKSQGEYCHFFGEDTGDLDTVTLDGNFSFDFVIEDLSLAIDNAVAEAFKSVEVDAGSKCRSTCISCDMEDGYEDWCGCNCHKDLTAYVQEVEDRKKQYLV